MKFVVVSYGICGDIEFCVVVGLELQWCGYDVCFVVLFNLIGFVEMVGLFVVVYGSRDFQEQFDEQFLYNVWKFQNFIKLLCEVMVFVIEGWVELSVMLMLVVVGVDLLLIGQIYQEVVVNVVEYYGILLVVLYFYLV